MKRDEKNAAIFLHFLEEEQKNIELFVKSFTCIFLASVI